MNNPNSNKYISLKAAGALYGYTRDHLGLMIRQNKLKGTKLGSYYVTTGEWMVDYIKNFSDPNHPMSRNKLSNKFLTEILSAKEPASRVASIKNAKSNLTTKAVSGASQNTQNNVMGEPAINNNLGEKILKELAQYAPINDERILKNGLSQAKNAVSTLPGAQYSILPIRKMEDAEREDILNELDFG